MKKLLVLALVAFCVIGEVAARDIKTLSGRLYRNVKVTRVDPTGIAIEHKDGIEFLDFKDLSPELQREFNYVEATYVATQTATRERDALAEVQRRATVAAAAAQSLADQQARQTAAAALALAEKQKQEADAAALSIQQRDYSARDYGSRNYADRDYSGERYVPHSTPTDSGSSGGTVSVRGYTRKDGTYVRPYTRRR